MAAVCSLACVGLAEAGLRLVLGRRLAPLYDEDPVCLYRPIPANEKLVPRPSEDAGGLVLVRTNRDGFRGPELRPPGEARRILVYGDSCIAALFADIENTYPARLGKELEGRLAGKPFEVVNAGVAGYGPDQICLRMEGELGRYRPDLAIVALFADNDMGDIVRNRIFRLDGRGQLVRGEAVLGEALHEEFRSARSWAISKALCRTLGLLGRAVASGTAKGDGPDVTSLRLRREEYEEYLRDERVVRNLFEDGYDADVSCDPKGESARLKVALLSAVVGRIADASRRAEVPLAIMVIPTPADVCRDARGYDGMRVDARRFPEYDPRALADAMAAAARAHGVACLDLFGPFAAAENSAKLYYAGDNHWNNAGQALAARLTADFLLETGLVR